MTEIFAVQASAGLAQACLFWMAETQRIRATQILANSQDGILFVEAETGRVEANQAFERLLGCPADQAMGVAQYIGRFRCSARCQRKSCHGDSLSTGGKRVAPSS